MTALMTKRICMSYNNVIYNNDLLPQSEYTFTLNGTIIYDSGLNIMALTIVESEISIYHYSKHSTNFIRLLKTLLQVLGN